jgi:hypothetical protein
MNVSGTQITISGLVGTAIGTPSDYSHSADLLDYDGDDPTNLPNVSAITGLPVEITGDAVPVYSKLEWSAGAWRLTTRMTKPLASATGLGSGAFQGKATDCAFDSISSITAGQTSHESELRAIISLLPWAGGFGDAWCYDGSLTTTLKDAANNPVPQFDFPLYILGGSLAVPSTFPIYSVLDSMVTVSLSRSLAEVYSGSASGFWGRGGLKILDFSNAWIDIEFGTDTIYISNVVPGMTQNSFGVLHYSGGNSDLNDAAGRPVPPFPDQILH